MAITFEETVQAVLNLVLEKEKLMALVKELQEKIKVLESNVREPDNKPILKEVK